MFPLDRRKVALHMYSILNSLRKVASLINVHYSTISRWVHTVERKPYTFKDTSSHKTELVKEVVKSAIQVNPLTSIRKLQTIIFEASKVSVSHELVRCVIRCLGLTNKKAKFFSVPKTQPEKVQDFLSARAQFQQQNKNFISIDETSFGRNWCETRSFAPKGHPLYMLRKQPRMTSTSVLAASTVAGWLKTKQQQKPFNTLSFLEFLKELDLDQRHVVLLDNVAFHHSKVVKEFFKERRINVLYTPPYCPWFNPIELCFSIVKRQFPVLQDIQASFNSLRPSHFEAFFQKSLLCKDKY